MRLETFFGKFEQFTDAPNAVEKMRELVLNLAVQGRLVQQDAADEGVEHLLTGNDKARRATAKSDRRADADNLPLLSADDRWEIAETWSWRALADLVLFVDYRGKTPIKLSHGIRLLTAKNVRKGEINLSPEEFLSEEDYHAWMTRGFPKASDVLFTTEAPMGNAAVVKLMDPFALAQRVICFQSYGAVDSSFLVLQILSRQFQFILDKNGTGVTAKGIKASKLKQLPIALPPLAEQKRIVAKVAELMALCDQLEAQNQERTTRHAALSRASLARFANAPTPANLDLLFHPSYAIAPADIRKAILTLAVQGKLVPQDSNDEPADVLLTRVAAEKLRLVQKKMIKSESSLAPISEKEVLFPIPESWALIRAGDLCRPISSGSTPDQSVFHPSEGIPYLKVYNIRNQAVDFDYKRQYINLNHHKERMKRSKLLPGDVIMNIVGPPLGKVAIVPDTFAEWNCNQAIAFFSPIFPEFAPYLYLYLKEGSFLQNIQLIGTAGQDNISVTKCKFIPISIPPLAEQRRIVAKVDQLMALVDQLETQLAASRAAASKLMEAVVAELTAVTEDR